MHSTVQLTNTQARRFILRRLGLAGEYQYHGRQGAAGYIRHVHAVQVDPIDVCGRSHENTLHARVQGFAKPMLHSLLYKQRLFFEYHDKCLCILPVEEWPAFARARQRYAAYAWNKQSLLEAHVPARERLLQAGPLTPQGLALAGRTTEWPSWDNRGVPLANAVLEAMYYTGEAIIAGRRANQRMYHLAECCLPPALTTAPCPFGGDDGQYFAWQVKRRIAACGLLGRGPSDAWIGLEGFTAAPRNAAFDALLAKGELIEVQVKGLAAPLYALATDESLLAEVQAGAKYRARCELIAPLDSFIWDRKLIEKLFGFAYTWEIYTPAAKRRYGYYVLPVLWGEGFAARIELLTPKNGGPLEVKHIWPEAGVRRSKRLDSALTHCLNRFAKFHGCEGVAGYEDAFQQF